MQLIIDSESDGEAKLRRAANADSAYYVLWEMRELFRNALKYGPDKTTEEWRDTLQRSMEDKGIDLENDYR